MNTRQKLLNFHSRSILMSAIAVMLAALPMGCQAINTETETVDSMSDRNAAATSAIAGYYVNRYSTSEGTHIESVLSAIGASAGFGCQMAIREAFIKPGTVSEDKAFVIITTKDGEKYYYGDFLNQPLLEAKVSVWSIVRGAAQKAGASKLPNPMEIAGYNADSVGSEQFGIPRLSKGHMPKEMPAAALRATWKDIQAILEKHQVDPQFWGWVPAASAQKVIIENKNELDPSLAAKIVMESALPMSKVNPATSVDW